MRKLGLTGLLLVGVSLISSCVPTKSVQPVPKISEPPRTFFGGAISYGYDSPAKELMKQVETLRARAEGKPLEEIPDEILYVDWKRADADGDYKVTSLEAANYHRKMCDVTGTMCEANYDDPLFPKKDIGSW